MNRYHVIAVSVALLIPGIAAAHSDGHWKHSEHRKYEKKIEHHQRKAEHYYKKAREHMRVARRSAYKVDRIAVRGPIYGRVLSVQPVYAEREGRRGSGSCAQWSENYNSQHMAWGPTIVGGVLGSAIGYHLGEDHGDPEVATIAGGLLGAAAGHGVGKHVYDSRHILVSGGCRPQRLKRHDSRRVAYWVTYRYNGHIYREHMDYDPGEWVRLNDEASPA